jgi:hypothetical protein
VHVQWSSTQCDRHITLPRRNREEIFMRKHGMIHRTASVVAAAGFAAIGTGLISPAASAAAAPGQTGTAGLTVQGVLSNVTPDVCSWVARNQCCEVL